ncbi:M15 family metallopeptidase [Dyadobacter sp. CY351]|uniref:M15 family metallopeptidase n=1 Tax=Dyadobacter sp. CY351 TaxID=2909337 RepID=UPI001F26D04C|nr:M15 family metallopeptidase [Dyadobacter sp. CY351]MCF2517886.1 M15 family metallopeptidase [Dyadobacter sp. CY351]
MNIFAAYRNDIHFFMPIKITCSLLIWLLISGQSFAQKAEKESVRDLKTPAIEQKMIEQGLVDIQKLDPNIKVELKYSTTDNFVGKDVYGDLNRAYLQPEMARRLVKANALIRKKHPDYTLLVYDAARPNSVQYALWDALDNLKIPVKNKKMYVADPKIGSNHNFGCAVDLTVVDGKGKPLDMGTKYDFFGPLAYPRSEQEMLKKGKLTQQQISNRQILRTAMNQAGFKTNTTEWWHFDGMSKAQARAKYGMIK